MPKGVDPGLALQAGQGRVLPGILPAFAVTLFLSALLLFWVQPMFTKMVLPMLGGVPAVWNTAMLFFQTALLAGYAYAHLSSRFLGLRWQVILHLGLLALAATALPIAVAPGWTPPTEGMPVGWLIGLFAVSVGLPFFVVSATAPLLQRWFSHSGHETADDPYYLYGASNIGSMLALLGYPVLVEPALTLAGQSWSWASGYGVLGLLIVLCAVYLLRGAVGEGWAVRARPVALAMPEDRSVGWRRRAHWLALAFVPSSLLLGVTSHITTDIAAVPLFWVIPLALYLLTFVLTFSRKPILRHEWMLRAQAVVFPILGLVFLLQKPILPVTLLHLAGFFLGAMVCHGELWRKRPETSHLTEFYLWMSFGGMLGGVFNALVSPVLFDSVVEYPLALVLACALRPWNALRISLPEPAKIVAVILPAGLCLGVTMLLDLAEIEPWQVGMFAAIIALTLTIYTQSRQPLVFAACIAGFLALVPAFLGSQSDILVRERSFFGVHTVKIIDQGRVTALVHGTTIHGAQYRDPERRRTRLTYYVEAGPAGSVFAALPATDTPRRIGVIGLGTGSMACYRRPGEDWRFYEIDPLVTHLARDSGHFHFLSDCAPDMPIIHGDARVSLERSGDGPFDLLVVDAFSSDVVPIHLITREAVSLYGRRLAPGGILLMHISNRNLNLRPALAAVLAEAGFSARVQRYVPDAAAAAEALATATVAEWVAASADPAALSILDGDPRWEPLAAEPDYRAWTDDYSNIFRALNW